jgi:hypothetical protein
VTITKPTTMLNLLFLFVIIQVGSEFGTRSNSKTTSNNSKTTSTMSTLSSQGPNFISTKIYFQPGNQIRRLNLNPSEADYYELQDYLVNAYASISGDKPDEFTIQMQYLDAENDWIYVDSEQEWKDALYSFQTEQQEKKKLFCLRVTVIKNQQITPNKQDGKTIVHNFVVCDHCDKNSIEGVRYKCNTCEDYDLCQECYPKRAAFHDLNHIFTPIEKPSFHLWANHCQGSCPFKRMGHWAANEMSNSARENTQTRRAQQSNSAHQEASQPQSLQHALGEQISGLVNSYLSQLSETISKNVPPVNLHPGFIQNFMPHSPFYPFGGPAPQQAQQQQQPQEYPTQQQQPQPQPQQQQQDNSEYEHQMQELISMGFYDKETNLQLLRRHKGDISKVVANLLERN